jgi:hypothetical protein
MLDGGGMLQAHIGKGIEQRSVDIEVGEGQQNEGIRNEALSRSTAIEHERMQPTSDTG